MVGVAHGNGVMGTRRDKTIDVLLGPAPCPARLFAEHGELRDQAGYKQVQGQKFKGADIEGLDLTMSGLSSGGMRASST